MSHFFLSLDILRKMNAGPSILKTKGTQTDNHATSSESGKGLRHFSMKVCQKVKDKGTTTYDEVADELVAELVRTAFSGRFSGGDAKPFDQKNIRQRVYDVLNVLLAMNIINKEKNEIKWIGLPIIESQEVVELEKRKQEALERISAKKEKLRDLLIQLQLDTQEPKDADFSERTMCKNSDF